MYIVPIGFFIIFLITTAMGLLFIFKLKKKSKYNIANGTIALEIELKHNKWIRERIFRLLMKEQRRRNV